MTQKKRNTAMQSAGAEFRRLVAEEPPLQVVGTINAYTALMARRLGHRAIYLSGGGVAANSRTWGSARWKTC